MLIWELSWIDGQIDGGIVRERESLTEHHSSHQVHTCATNFCLQSWCSAEDQHFLVCALVLSCWPPASGLTDSAWRTLGFALHLEGTHADTDVLLHFRELT